MKSTEASRVEQILDLLLDALAERQSTRRGPDEELVSTPALVEFEDLAPEEGVESPLLAGPIEDHGREEIDPPVPVRDTLPIPPAVPVPVGQMASTLPRLVVGLLLSLMVLSNAMFEGGGRPRLVLMQVHLRLARAATVLALRLCCLAPSAACA